MRTLILVLKIDLIPLTDFDLLDILDLLKSLLIALVADLGTLVPLVTTAIDRSRVGVLYETLK